jgi:hypothetical protein
MSPRPTTEWVAEELAGVDLGDERLNKRCKRILERLAADPQASINGACRGWNETHAAYQFFSHEAVDEHQILAPHRQATLERMKSSSVVLLVQDTTELDYTRIKRKLIDAGPLDKQYRRGFYNHLQVAFTPQRLCLGVVSMRLWARDDETFDTCKQRKHTPIEEKESYRWLEGYRSACQVAEELPQTQIVSISDREGDIYECFLEARQPGPPRRADWIIRASANRNLPERDTEAGDACYAKLFDAIAQAPVLGTRIVRVPRTAKHKARKAKVTLRAQGIRLKPPYRAHVRLPEIAINVILVKEESPPAGEEPLVWLLLTSLPIERLTDVLRVVDYYGCRWQIEVYFRVFKVGCKVEEIQLEKAGRLRACLALYEIVAWRVLYVTMLGREAPDLPCSALFSEEEWKSAWSICADKPLPKRPPRLKTFLPLIAELGGYNGREHDGPPGPKAIWIGIRRMTDFALAWSTFGPKEKTYV